MIDFRLEKKIKEALRNIHEVYATEKIVVELHPDGSVSVQSLEEILEGEHNG